MSVIMLNHKWLSGKASSSLYGRANNKEKKNWLLLHNLIIFLTFD